MKKSILGIAFVLAFTTALHAQKSWPPAKQKESEFTGRKLDTYQHGSRPESGYAEPQPPAKSRPMIRAASRFAGCESRRRRPA